ncbi:zinc finger protein 569-like [Lytechinus pictus]|uniref:zinc finger protein 569-like n=1 Tax=Lytechinus pictus TaxID=7653 RepID=UPI0030B9C853
MEYNYIHDQQETRSNQESGQGQPQIQPPLQYHHHQQYPPPPHHAIQSGYHGLRLAPYINSLQAPVSLAGQVPSSEGLHLSRSSVTSGSTTITNRESPGQRGHNYDHVLAAAMQVDSTSLHYQAALSSGAVQPQQVPTTLPATVATPPSLQPPSTLNSSQDPSYLIEDLSNSTRNSVAATQSTMHATPPHCNPAVSNINPVSPTTLISKKKGPPRTRTKRDSLPQPMVQIVEPQVQHHRRKEYVPSFTKYCQTEPLFDEIWKSEGVRAEPSSLPSGLAFIQSVGEENKIKGVTSQKDLEEGETFGPYTGEFVKEGLGCYNPSTWEVCVRGRAWFYLDGSMDPDNWMHHVQYARNTKELNMEAFQSYGDIYFRITKPIKSGTELRVFYSPEYRKRVGFQTSLDELQVDQDNQMFQCQDCKCRYTNAKSLSRHLKFEHDKENLRNVADLKVNVQSQIFTSPRLEFITSFRKKEARTGNAAAEEPVAEDTPKKNLTEEKSKKFLQVKYVPLKTGKQSTAGDSRANRSKKRDLMKRFSCKRCGKLFPSEGHLREHSAFHQETKDIKPICEVCGLECKHQRALKQHMLSHDSSSFQCQKCHKFFKRKGCYVYHLRHDHKIFVGTRWMRGSIEDQMTRYVGPEEETEESPQPFHPELPKDMLGKRILITSKKPKVFKCKYCPKKFSAHNLVYKHEMTVHTNSGRYKCEFCPQTFIEKTRFMVHRRKHTLDRPFKCEECPRSFSSESALKNHLPEHRGERPYQCDICGKGFRTRKYMTTHKRRVHMAPTVFLNCSFCDKTFKHKTALSRHEKCHKGIRPHVCLTCGRAFGTKCSLQSHMHIHTGEKPFECPVCQQKFALSHHLSTHMIRHDRKALAAPSDKDPVDV